MTTQSELDFSGTFQAYPFPELITEIMAGSLSGAFRISRGEQKVIVYFDSGSVIFAVSNARKYRLFDMLLKSGKIDKEMLAKTPNFANDMELAAAIKEKGIMTEQQVTDLFVEQVQGLLTESLGWPDGDWTYSPLARLRSGIRVDLDMPQILADYARNLSHNAISFRYKSLHEMFAATEETDSDIELDPQEEYLLSCLTSTPQTIAAIIVSSGFTENETMKLLYVLWLGHLAVRSDWSPAFSDARLARLKGASFKLTRSALNVQKPKAPEQEAVVEAPVDEPVVVKEVTLEEYLGRTERLETHYSILGIPMTAELPDVRNAYFALAKSFHPDRFHRGDPAILRRVENAFSKLAQAHEALRDPKKRMAYDNQLKREEAEKKAQPDKPLDVKVEGNQLNAERAGQEFEHGRKLLLDGDCDEALPFLARAVHLDPKKPAYHAFYGKALSYTDNGRHKAENEMQSAIKLEPNNTVFRMMLAEFFVNVRLVKRAEGELNRLLTIAPDNKEARSLLDSLQQK